MVVGSKSSLPAAPVYRQMHSGTVFTASSTCLVSVLQRIFRGEQTGVVLSSADRRFSRRKASVNWLKNWSAMFSCGIKRFAAVHTASVVESRLCADLHRLLQTGIIQYHKHHYRPVRGRFDVFCRRGCHHAALFPNRLALPLDAIVGDDFRHLLWEIKGWSTPFGRSASRTRWAKVSAQCGTILACLAMSGSPPPGLAPVPASAGSKGKFQVPTAISTPTGWCSTRGLADVGGYFTGARNDFALSA